MSESFFSGIDLQIHRVQSVQAKLTERRDCESCEDHDVYELQITSVLMDGDGETNIRLVLYTAAGADIGLNPLVRPETLDEMAARLRRLAQDAESAEPGWGEGERADDDARDVAQVAAEQEALDAALDLAEESVEALPVELDASTMHEIAKVYAAERNAPMSPADGPCTGRQERVLRRAGLRPDLSRAEATQALDALAGAGYRVTPEIKARWGVLWRCQECGADADGCYCDEDAEEIKAEVTGD